MNKKFPWDKVERGQGFFVPSLNYEETVKEGMRAAIHMRFRDKIHTEYGVLNGMMGVLFFRAAPPAVHEPRKRQKS